MKIDFWKYRNHIEIILNMNKAFLKLSQIVPVPPSPSSARYAKTATKQKQVERKCFFEEFHIFPKNLETS